MPVVRLIIQQPTCAALKGPGEPVVARRRFFCSMRVHKQIQGGMTSLL